MRDCRYWRLEGLLVFQWAKNKAEKKKEVSREENTFMPVPKNIFWGKKYQTLQLAKLNHEA